MNSRPYHYKNELIFAHTTIIFGLRKNLKHLLIKPNNSELCYCYIRDPRRASSDLLLLSILKNVESDGSTLCAPLKLC